MNLYVLEENNFEDIFKKHNINNIKKNSFGKKVCDNIFFSIGHSFNKHAIVVLDCQVGIDIEKLTSTHS